MRPLSSKIKRSLCNSYISGVNKTFVWTIDSENDCLLHDNKLKTVLMKRMPILELVSELKFVVSESHEDAWLCHRNFQNVAEIIFELPQGFDKSRITIEHTSYGGARNSDWLKLNHVISE